MKNHIYIITVIAVLITTPCAMARKIASDDFDSYEAGRTLVGATGGKGSWRSPWTGQAGFVTITNAPEDVVTLTLDNGEVRGGGNALKIFGGSGGGELKNVLGRRIPEMKGPDLFVSFLFKIRNDRPGQTTGANDGIQITNNNLTQWFAEDDEHEHLKDIAAFIGWNGKAGARLAEIDAGSTMPERLVAGRTYHLVIKYTGWNKTKDVRYQWCRIWINPSVNDEYTQNKSITYARLGKTAGFGSKGIRGLYVNTLGLTNSGKYHLIDDIRLGTTWADVVGKVKK